MPETSSWPSMPTGVAVRVQSAGTLPDPVAAASTSLIRVRWAGWSLLLIVQVTSPPTGTTTEVSVTVPPVHDQSPAVYPPGPPDSDNVYVPALTPALVTAPDPVVPEIGVGPAADSVQSVGIAVPPKVFVTVFSSVSCAGTSTLIKVQLPVCSGGTTTLPSRGWPDVTSQVADSSAYPGGPVSVMTYSTFGRTSNDRKTSDPVTVTGSSPGGTLTPVGVAVSVKSPATAVPPWVLFTILRSWRIAVSLTAVQRTQFPRGTVTPPFRPSLNPGITVVPSGATSTQSQLTVEPGIGSANSLARWR